jgi:hypothetical protein
VCVCMCVCVCVCVCVCGRMVWKLASMLSSPSLLGVREGCEGCQSSSFGARCQAHIVRLDLERHSKICLS